MLAVDNIFTVLEFPVSALLGLLFVLAVYLLHLHYADSRSIAILRGWRFTLILLTLAAAQLALEGIWGHPLHRSLPFAATVLLMQMNLLLAIFARLPRSTDASPAAVHTTAFASYSDASPAAVPTTAFASYSDAPPAAENHRSARKSSLPLRRFSFLATHIGFFLVLWAGFWGAPDVVDCNLQVDRTHSTYIAYNSRGGVETLPFKLRLEDFRIDYYEDGSTPKQYTSMLEVTDAARDGRKTSIPTSVNHPARYRRYYIYQEGYDRENQAYTVLRAVRDPWLPLVYVGMILLLCGASLMLAGRWKMKILLPSAILLALVFTVASIARINFGALPPALRSLWFVPHLLIYMLAYSIMALAVILLIINCVRQKKSSSPNAAGQIADGRTSCDALESGVYDRHAIDAAGPSLGDIADRLMRTCSVLLLCGMLCGCFWAKKAWGDYWAWDPKECWAAVTWLITLIFIHIPSINKNKIISLSVAVLAFMALQLTWYGVNYLPSADRSMHTYNSNSEF